MKLSTQLFALLFIAFPLFSSCVLSNEKTVIRGNYQMINQRIDIGNYNTLILNIPANIYYQQFSDSAPYLQINTDYNIFNALNVRIENDQLIIDVKKDSIIKPSQLTIYTCSRHLDQVRVAGSGEVHMKGEVNADEFKLDIFGSGSILVDSLLCNTISARITGSGNAQLTGAGVKSSLTVIGSGKIQAFNYLVQELTGNITGSGEIEALVLKRLDATIIGSGNLHYRGSPPQVTRKITGSGKVRFEK